MVLVLVLVLVKLLRDVEEAAVADVLALESWIPSTTGEEASEDVVDEEGSDRGISSERVLENTISSVGAEDTDAAVVLGVGVDGNDDVGSTGAGIVIVVPEPPPMILSTDIALQWF